MSELKTFLAETGQKVDAVLSDLIVEHGGSSERLTDAMRWSLLAGGKRFRPALLIAAGRAFGVEDNQMLHSAAAVEMIHTYSLIHDDLPSMDNDDLRRGRATCHVKFGEATAILAGDALQAIAFRAIAEDKDLSVENRLLIVSELARAATKMVAGQQMDLEAEGVAATIGEIEKIHQNKTGALICASAISGAIIGGASAEELSAVRNYADKLGLLFQITDDLLDITQTTEMLGKTGGKDMTAEKATYPAFYGIEKTTELAGQVHAESCGFLDQLEKPTELLRQIADYILTRES